MTSSAPSPPTPVGLAALSLTGLLGSAVALALAPALMPADYSWVTHTTSESAAQGVEGAWLARLGLLLFGLSALLVAVVRASCWPRLAVWLQSAFGVLLASSAAFSTRPWRPGVSFDRIEDTLHSFAATAMGFAFALGVVAVLALAPRAEEPVRRVVGVIAVAAAVLLPMGMGLFPQVQGVLQRCMFVIAYVWFMVEVLTRRRDLPSPAPERLVG